MSKNPLGQNSQYVSAYMPDLLFPIARSEKRSELKINNLRFYGVDIWNAYEVSWLNPDGLPQVAIAEFWVPADSPNIIESKSFKLYLNSFNQTMFEALEQVEQTLIQDVSSAAGSPVKVKLFKPQAFSRFQLAELDGELLDDLPISVSSYNYNSEILQHSGNKNELVSETLVSHLLKSNCLITSQPDWASIQVKYVGPKIDREKLLRYLVSFRSHNEFHEQCVERIFCDLKTFCEPQKLSVYARYTRRGGLDINPWRTDFETLITENKRLARQ